VNAIDGEEILRFAREIPIQTHTKLFPPERIDEALTRLKLDEIRGAGTLEVG
jgi:D-arabinose 1-dehydrogenase-like Zn-dependent alcohol dehydrogenase